MNLRDQIAERLARTFGGDISAHNFNAAADELIRLMEWARHEAFREWVSDSDAEYKLTTKFPLTLAPEGWKP